MFGKVDPLTYPEDHFIVMVESDNFEFIFNVWKGHHFSD